MKEIEQLLELSKNPYYKFTREEEVALDSFLSKRRDLDSKKFLKKNSDGSSKNTRVTVRNVVKKADTYPPESGQ